MIIFMRFIIPIPQPDIIHFTKINRYERTPDFERPDR